MAYLSTLLQGHWRGIRSSMCLRGSARQETLAPLQRPSRISTICHSLKIALVASLGLTAGAEQAVAAIQGQSSEEYLGTSTCSASMEIGPITTVMLRQNTVGGGGGPALVTLAVPLL